MADCFSPQKRSDVMRQIKSTDTAPELLLRKMLHAHGFRFRLHKTDLPGKPDIVLPKYQTVIFVHGCFWHSHACQKGRRPGTNTEYWNPKLERNKNRDEQNLQKCRELGWSPVVVWACEMRQPENVIRRLTNLLTPDRL